MRDPYAEMMRRLTHTVLRGPGKLDAPLRQAAAAPSDAAEDALPEALNAYTRKVVEHAYQVTDGDLAALKAADYSEDQIFELTVSAALGAALTRMQACLVALQAAEPVQPVEQTGHEGDWLMRLNVVRKGRGLRAKLTMRMIRVVSRDPSQPLDIVRTMLYRPAFFGKPATEIIHMVMRGPSEWSVGECELFAAFTSHLNSCQF